jgi:glycosyltransferase involved in cell wall biosynthesis
MGGDGNGGSTFDVVCCSMETWDEVWRRNQFLVSEALDIEPSMRLLFVEPVADIPWSLLHRKPLPRTGIRPIGDSGRLWAVTLPKWLPRRVWPGVDHHLSHRVAATAAALGFRDPVAWINDNAYAPLVTETGWPSVYDITDDWLLADMTARRLERERSNDATMMKAASEVVVCSPSLQASRGAARPVTLIPNGVDVDHFRRIQSRPANLPAGRVVLYTGTLSSGRLDIDLCVDLAESLTGLATLTFVGPNSCSESDSARLRGAGAVLLGAQPYSEIPAYLQHSDVIVVPHLVNSFTESLDPIKAREIVAVGRAAVATPVAGFRELGPPVTVASGSEFVAAVVEYLRRGPVAPGPGEMQEQPGSWRQRAEEFVEVLKRARHV